MVRILPLLLLVVVGCSRTPEVIEPEEIDVCPVLADQIENLLDSIVDFAEEATIEELTASDGPAAELRTRGVELSERAVALGCSADEIRSRITVRPSDDPIAGQFVQLVLDALG